MFKIKDNTTLICEGTLCRMEYGKMPDFGGRKNSGGDNLYYQISIRTAPPEMDVINFLMSDGVFGSEQVAFIPKWIKSPDLTESGELFANFKSLYPVTVTTDGKSSIKWADFIAEHGNAIGSKVRVSVKAKKGALYPVAVWFYDEIKSVSVENLF